MADALTHPATTDDLRRASPEALVALCPLPATSRGLILTVVGMSGVRRAERVDLTRELIAHFTDAIRSGQSEEDACREFGDPKAAALLMGRAIRRRRGLFSRGCRWIGRGTLAALVVAALTYSALWVRFFWSGPTIAMQPLVRLQAITPFGEVAERAWPLYRAALAKLDRAERAHGWREAAGTKGAHSSHHAPLLAVRAGEPGWDEAERVLAEESDALAALRAGAARPHLGVAYGPLSPDDAAFQAELGIPVPPPSAGGDESWDASIWQLPIPHLSHVHTVHQWLAADVRHAIASGETTRAVDSIEALLGLARQINRPLVIEQLVAQAFLSSAASLVLDALAMNPDRFDESELARLATSFASIEGRQFAMRIEGERIGFEDALQRLYSDDGFGDGHLVSTALGPSVTPSTVTPRRTESTWQQLVAPMIAATAPSRREASDRFRRYRDQFEALAQKNPWTWTAEDEAFIAHGVTGEVSPYPALASHLDPLWDNALLPLSVARSLTIPPMTRLRIDVARLAIAFTRHRQRHGAWPRDAAALDPAIRAAMGPWPTDPYDGQPIRVVLIDDEPVFWSVGPDRIAEDGDALLWLAEPSSGPTGKAPDWTQRFVPSNQLQQSATSDQAHPRGDLRLWPRFNPEAADAGAIVRPK